MAVDGWACLGRGRAGAPHARERRPSGEERAKRAAPGVGGDTPLDQSESRLVARHRSRDGKRERDQRTQQCGRHEREDYPPDGEGDYTGHECDQKRADQAGDEGAARAFAQSQASKAPRKRRRKKS